MQLKNNNDRQKEHAVAKWRRHAKLMPQDASISLSAMNFRALARIRRQLGAQARQQSIPRAFVALMARRFRLPGQIAQCSRAEGRGAAFEAVHQPLVGIALASEQHRLQVLVLAQKNLQRRDEQVAIAAHARFGPRPGLCPLYPANP